MAVEYRKTMNSAGSEETISTIAKHEWRGDNTLVGRGKFDLISGVTNYDQLNFLLKETFSTKIVAASHVTLGPLLEFHAFELKKNSHIYLFPVPEYKKKTHFLIFSQSVQLRFVFNTHILCIDHSSPLHGVIVIVIFFNIKNSEQF